MNPKLVLQRLTLIVASAACAAALSGCWRERHVVGENVSDAATGLPDGAVGGTEASTMLDAGDASTGDAGTATVVSLGDEASRGWLIAITPEEVAKRLSEFLLRKPPSAALTAAIVASAPKTNQDVGQLTDGLLLDDGSLAGRQAFYWWWLRLGDVLTIARDPTLFPTFTVDVRSALIDQTLAFVEDITWRPQGDLATLLTEPAAFVTTATAAWFPGTVVPAGTSATRVDLDASRYAGIVTQPAVVVSPNYPTRAEPSGRGLKMRARYLCQPLPLDPGIGVPPIPAGVSIRQWLQSDAESNPSCAACHRWIDWPGFAFGHFDAIGVYQDTEGGLAVDTSGLLTKTSAASDLVFEDAPGLAKQLAQLPEVRTCFAAKWLAFVTGKFPDADTVAAPSDGDALTADTDYVVKRATIQGRLNLRGTIRAVTETHTFLDP